MFVGHYGAALALKSVEQKAPLGLLFLGVQFVDVLFFPLVLFGIERMTIVPHATDSTHFQLEYMPFTHSLLGSFLWAALFGFVFALARRRTEHRVRIAFALGAAVFSHWIFDLFVHTPDLPLVTNSSAKLGLGLWNSAPVTFGLEAALLVVGLCMYMKTTVPAPKSALARLGMPGLVTFLLLLNVYNLFGPPPPGFAGVFFLAMVSYLGFAGIAFWLDRLRTPARNPNRLEETLSEVV
jgi:hypothetical protein